MVDKNLTRLPILFRPMSSKDPDDDDDEVEEELDCPLFIICCIVKIMTSFMFVEEVGH